MKKLSRKISIFLSVLLIPLFIPQGVFAADIDVAIDLKYSVNQEGVMHITETRTIKNNSRRYYIKKDSEEVFIISTFKTRAQPEVEDLEKMSETVTLKNAGGVDLQPVISIQDNQIEVRVKLTEDLDFGESMALILEYDNFELAEKSGNVWNIYLPGMPEDHNQVVTASNGSTQQTIYSVSLLLDETLGEPTFVLPEPVESTTTNGTMEYSFNTESLINQHAWIQIGNKQYYQFTISQQVQSTQVATSKIFNTWYDVLLPPNSTNQKVYFSSLSPEPDYITVDGEGNTIARFSFSSDKSGEIKIEGIIVTNITETIIKDDVGSVSDIDLGKEYALVKEEQKYLSDLTTDQEFWEVKADEIQEKSVELSTDLENVYDILLADYTFVTESVDYDNLKIGVNNKRQGALKTLQGGSSVCMEYSDLLITLLRAQGIPARAAFGYGFDHRAGGEQDEAHQWVEVYMPNVGWVAVDPTWGDTGRRNYIGGDVDHALWYVAGLSVDEPSPVVKYSIVDDTTLEAPTFDIKVVEQVDLENLTTYDELLAQYSHNTTHIVIEKFNQLNNYGKTLFLVIAGIFGLLFLLLIFSIIIKLVRKLFSKNVVIAGPASHDTPNNPHY
jgi:hypothetical protein